MSDEAKPVELHYVRTGKLVKCSLRQMTNHELREILIGYWARLDEDDRVDFVAELVHYAEYLTAPDKYRDRHLSPIAQAIRTKGGSMT